MPPSSETSAPPISDQWPDWWISSLRASRANPIALLDCGPELRTRGTCGRTPPECLARFDPATCSWRTPAFTFAKGVSRHTLTPSWRTLPRWGMTRNGALYPLKPPAPPTSENAGFVWPTLLASDGENQGPSLLAKTQYIGLQAAVMKMPTLKARDAGGATEWDLSRNSPNLNLFLRYLPTLTAHDAKNSGPSQANRQSPPLISLLPTLLACDAEKQSVAHGNGNKTLRGALLSTNGGLLNPTWCEWFMGFPDGWTALEPSAIASFQRWLRCFTS